MKSNEDEKLPLRYQTPLYESGQGSISLAQYLVQDCTGVCYRTTNKDVWQGNEAIPPFVSSMKVNPLSVLFIHINVCPEPGRTGA